MVTWSSRLDLPKRLHFPIQSMKDGLPRGRQPQADQKKVEVKVRLETQAKAQVEVEVDPRVRGWANLLVEKRRKQCAGRLREQLCERRPTHWFRRSEKLLKALPDELPDQPRVALPDHASGVDELARPPRSGSADVLK